MFKVGFVLAGSALASEPFTESAKFERWSHFKDYGVPAVMGKDALNSAAIADGSCRMTGLEFDGFYFWHYPGRVERVLQALKDAPPTSNPSLFVLSADKALRVACGDKQDKPSETRYEVDALAGSVQNWYHALTAPASDATWKGQFDPAYQPQQVALTAGFFCIAACDLNKGELSSSSMRAVAASYAELPRGFNAILPWTSGSAVFSGAKSADDLAKSTQPLLMTCGCKESQGLLKDQGNAGAYGQPLGPVAKSIAHHNEAFGALDVDSILLDFTDDSILRIFNQADGSLKIFKGLAELKVGFTGLLGKFVNMSDVSVPVSIIEENTPEGPGGAYTAGSNPASGFRFFHDVFVADSNGKLFRQDAFLHHVAPGAANGVAESPVTLGPVHQSIANHNAAFGALNVDKILQDFTNSSVLRVFNQADGSLEIWKGLAELKVGFTRLLNKFVDMSDVSVPVSIVEENTPQGPGGGFTAGSNPASGFEFFSDVFVADANGKLFRQNAFIHHVAPKVTKGDEVLV